MSDSSAVSMHKLNKVVPPQALQRFLPPPEPQDVSRKPELTTPAERHKKGDFEPGSVKSFRAWSFSAQYALERFIARPGLHTEPDEAVTQAKRDALLQRAGRRAEDEKLLRTVKALGESHRNTLQAKIAARLTAKAPPPGIRDMADVALRAYPSRMHLPVLVCDISDSKSVIYEGRVGNIESYWKDKPAGVKIRWIHAPLGSGIIQSSIEDIFCHDAPPGRSFPQAGGHGFSFLEVDLLHFREKAELAHQRDVYSTLSGNKDLQEELNKDCLRNDQNRTFAYDLQWREKHRREARNFWTLSTADIPWELSEHIASYNRGGRWRPTGLLGAMDSSVLSRTCKQFERAQLVVAPFRCFHRKDGILLTMSAASGVDNLQKSFADDIQGPLLDRQLNRDASIVGSMMHWLQERGTIGWHDTSVEWFMIYLITEIATAPTNMCSGRAAVSMVSALQGGVLDMKERRHDEFQRHKTPQLVRDYITCVDSLKLLSLSYTRKLQFLERLTEDLHEHQKEDACKAMDHQGRLHDLPHTHRTSFIRNEDANTAIERVEWAESIVRDEKIAVDFLLTDVNQALDALFQLRTIEQNERSIVTDLQNKAFFIFATVTVVFLPISVFTSYFGMNLADVRGTNWTQAKFWRTLGAIAVAIVVLIAVVVTNYYSIYRAFKRGLRRLFRRRQPVPTRASMV